MGENGGSPVAADTTGRACTTGTTLPARVPRANPLAVAATIPKVHQRNHPASAKTNERYRSTRSTADSLGRPTMAARNPEIEATS